MKMWAQVRMIASFGVLWMIVRESLVLCAVGIAVGLPAAYVGTRLLKAMLFGLEPGDPLSFIVALLAVAAVAVLASLVPAQRASAVEPVIALRTE